MGDIATLATEHKWALLAALIIGFVIRALKDDTVLPTIPKRARPWLALVGGLAVIVLEKAATGSSWKNAIVDGLIAGLMPMAGSDLFKTLVGRDVPMPGLTKSDPPKPPPLPLLFLLLLLVGCAGNPEPKTSRDVARSVVITLAEGVKLADTTCADAARATKDAKTAKTCVDAYAIAQPAMLAAAQTIDAWDSGSKAQVMCSIAQALGAMSSMIEAIKAAKADVPPLVADAVALAGGFSKGGCDGR